MGADAGSVTNRLTLPFICMLCMVPSASNDSLPTCGDCTNAHASTVVCASHVVRPSTGAYASECRREQVHHFADAN